LGAFLVMAMPMYIALILALTVATLNVALSAPSTIPPQPQQTASNDYRGSDAQRQACTPDVFRLCGQFIPDVTGIVACLQAQKPNLSPDCRATFSGRLR
jgi:hypothetical protein